MTIPAGALCFREKKERGTASNTKKEKSGRRGGEKGRHIFQCGVSRGLALIQLDAYESARKGAVIP